MPRQRFGRRFEYLYIHTVQQTGERPEIKHANLLCFAMLAGSMHVWSPTRANHHTEQSRTSYIYALCCCCCCAEAWFYTKCLCMYYCIYIYMLGAACVCHVSVYTKERCVRAKMVVFVGNGGNPNIRYASGRRCENERQRTTTSYRTWWASKFELIVRGVYPRN